MNEVEHRLFGELYHAYRILREAYAHDMHREPPATTDLQRRVQELLKVPPLIASQTTEPERVWLSVIATNAGAMDAKVPADHTLWTAADKRRVKALERFAEDVGTSIQRTSYRLL